MKKPRNSKIETRNSASGPGPNIESRISNIRVRKTVVARLFRGGAFRPAALKNPASEDAGYKIPRGFRFAATACGLKKKPGALDLALILSDAAAAAAAVFTKNLVQAAPVRVSREHLKKSRGRARAVIVNAGNANCSTGPVGWKAARATVDAVAREVGCAPREVLVCSTGVIGVPLRVGKILRALPALASAGANSAGDFSSVTRAIMTTDTRPKWAAARCRIGGKRVRILGCAKGSGMIAPDMATMLGFIVTDAAVPPRLLQQMLREVTARTFNCITVDGDTSTNDTVILLANGASGAALRGRSFSSDKLRQGKRGALAPEAKDYFAFLKALEAVCHKLALAIVADGEGAQRVIEIEVRGAGSAKAADQVARTIANSPLVKTAFAGADPNWGRILAAAGRAGVAFDPDRAEVWMAGMKVYSRGKALPFSEKVAHKKLLARYVKIVLDLHQSQFNSHQSRIWTCDFTQDYVHINASYRT